MSGLKSKVGQMYQQLFETLRFLYQKSRKIWNNIFTAWKEIGNNWNTNCFCKNTETVFGTSILLNNQCEGKIQQWYDLIMIFHFTILNYELLYLLIKKMIWHQNDLTPNMQCYLGSVFPTWKEIGNWNTWKDKWRVEILLLLIQNKTFHRFIWNNK